MKQLVACLLLLAALITPANARGLAQAASSSPESNPYSTNLEDMPVFLSVHDGVGGGDARIVNDTVLPGLAGTDVQAHLVTLLPCTSLAPHIHPTAHEFQYVLEGNLTFGIVDLAGNTYTKAVSKGDVDIAPMGLVHYNANESCEPAKVLLVFAGKASRVNLAPAIVRLGPQMAADALGLDSGTKLDSPMDDLIPITANGCPAKCEKKQ